MLKVLGLGLEFSGLGLMTCVLINITVFNALRMKRKPTKDAHRKRLCMTSNVTVKKSHETVERETEDEKNHRLRTMRT